MSEWIKCSNRQPKNSECIGYTYDGDKIRHDQWFDCSTQQWQEEYGMDYYGCVKKDILFWMPLPSPPEENKGKK